jgi:hypothetical protein
MSPTREDALGAAPSTKLRESGVGVAPLALRAGAPVAPLEPPEEAASGAIAAVREPVDMAATPAAGKEAEGEAARWFGTLGLEPGRAFAGGVPK